MEQQNQHFNQSGAELIQAGKKFKRAFWFKFFMTLTIILYVPVALASLVNGFMRDLRLRDEELAIVTFIFGAIVITLLVFYLVNYFGACKSLKKAGKSMIE